MLELDLKEMGNNGSFNFMLNSPIEYPNALVETLFINNPEDEMKMMDEGFQQQIADKIVLGIKIFSSLQTIDLLVYFVNDFVFFVVNFVATKSTKYLHQPHDYRLQQQKQRN